MKSKKNQRKKNLNQIIHKYKLQIVLGMLALITLFSLYSLSTTKSQEKIINQTITFTSCKPQESGMTLEEIKEFITYQIPQAWEESTVWKGVCNGNRIQYSIKLTGPENSIEISKVKDKTTASEMLERKSLENFTLHQTQIGDKKAVTWSKYNAWLHTYETGIFIPDGEFVWTIYAYGFAHDEGPSYLNNSVLSAFLSSIKFRK